jgi:hypothetical protein
MATGSSPTTAKFGLEPPAGFARDLRRVYDRIYLRPDTVRLSNQDGYAQHCSKTSGHSDRNSIVKGVSGANPFQACALVRRLTFVVEDGL